MKAFLGAVFMMGLGLGLVSCDEADELADCQTICSRYGDCYGNKGKYDVGACRSKCETEADKDKAYAKKLDACEKCIEGESCTASTFGCFTECAGVISSANSTQ